MYKILFAILLFLFSCNTDKTKTAKKEVITNIQYFNDSLVKDENENPTDTLLIYNQGYSVLLDTLLLINGEWISRTGKAEILNTDSIKTQ